MICSKCKIEKGEDFSPSYLKQGSGKCRECYKVYHREKYNEMYKMNKDIKYLFKK